MEIAMRVKKKNILGALLMIPFLKLRSFEYIVPTLDITFDIGKVVALIVLVVLYVKISPSTRPDKMFVAVGLWCISYILSMLNNLGNTSYWNTFREIATVIAAYLYVVTMVVHYRINLRLIQRLLEFILIINLISWCFFPDGIYTLKSSFGGIYSRRNWIVGPKNCYFIYVYAALVIHALTCFERGKKHRVLFLYCICALNMFLLSESSTAAYAHGHLLQNTDI